MNREDIINGYMMVPKLHIAEMLFDTIAKYENKLDEIKSRTCESCRYWGLEYEAIGICALTDCYKKIDNYKKSTQYCSEWERKR